MVIKARILHIGDERSGVSERGAWCYTPVVAEWERQDTPETAPYTQSLVVDIWGKLNREALEAAMQENRKIHVWINIRAKEYQGKWYNGIQGNVGEEYKPPLPASPEGEE